MTNKYHVVIFDDGKASGKASDKAYLTHKGRDAWSKRVALKHAKEFTAAHGNRTEIEEA